VTASDLNAVVHAAGRALQGLQMTRIAGNYPSPADAQNLNDDLEVIWGIVDPIITAIGAYAAEHLPGVTDVDVKRHFVDQLRGALEGNATFVLSEAESRIRDELLEAV
jgi:hypothetical protein